LGCKGMRTGGVAVSAERLGGKVEVEAGDVSKGDVGMSGNVGSRGWRGGEGIYVLWGRRVYVGGGEWEIGRAGGGGDKEGRSGQK
jgi:hypothetical protein